MIGECCPQHRARELRKLLDVIDAAVPADLDVHLVLDNCATHMTLIRRWLAKRSAIICTPRGSHRSPRALIAATEQYLEVTNETRSRSSGPKRLTRSSQV